MMRGELLCWDGRRIRLPDAVEWRFQYGYGTPCDSFQLTCLWEPRLLSKEATQIEMGKISNLITDMTLKGAPTEDITKAVRHSMVVIDAAKHKLDYKRSEIENDIPTLRKRWQGYTDPETGAGGPLLS